MRLSSTRFIPALIVAIVLGGVCLLQTLPRWLVIEGRPGESHFTLFNRIEWMTYDWRMRLAFGQKAASATNLAAVLIDDENLTKVNEAWGYHWPWPRHVFGKALRELTAQQCRAVACDVFFLERHADFVETRVKSTDGRVSSSDQFFADQLRAAGNVLLGSPLEAAGNRWRLLPPAEPFRTNAADLGYASTDRDPDGVLRRARPFRDDARYGRVWHLGLRLAAAQLQLDLTNAVVKADEIVLRGPAGIQRVIPLDEQGYFLIDWNLAWYDKRITNVAFDDLVDFDGFRQAGETNLESILTDKLVVIGSIGAGSNISDIGASPVAKETYLVSKHWNVANSLLMNRFIRPPRWFEEIGLIVALGILAGVLTWQLRALAASVSVLALVGGYVWLSVWAFQAHRLWLPLALPVGGALLMTHVCLVTWRVVCEQQERRRVHSIFSRVVSPEVVEELLVQQKLSLGGSLREMTVLFADIRGFTKFTDESQRRIQEEVRVQQLRGGRAEAALEENARETLTIVNQYLAVIADCVKHHRGTIDKYIGDCAMAFWGAPVKSDRHATAAVKAAIDAQCAIAELNARRAKENETAERDNVTRKAAGLPLVRTQPVLTLGTGINTGLMTVGLMGSDQHGLNYTVFGREVNLASRLEGVSGSGRIVISTSTYEALCRDAPDLAKMCVQLPPVTVKGISETVTAYEVPWRTIGPVPGGTVFTSG